MRVYGLETVTEKALPSFLLMLFVNLQLHELSPFVVDARYHVPLIVEQRVELHEPLFWSVNVHNFIAEDMLVLLRKWQSSCVNTLTLHFQMVHLIVIVDAQVPPVACHPLEGFRCSERLLLFCSSIFSLKACQIC